jgi:hypothetical protein
MSESDKTKLEKRSHYHGYRPNGPTTSQSAKSESATTKPDRKSCYDDYRPNNTVDQPNKSTDPPNLEIPRTGSPTSYTDMAEDGSNAETDNTGNGSSSKPERKTV